MLFWESTLFYLHLSCRKGIDPIQKDGLWGGYHDRWSRASRAGVHPNIDRSWGHGAGNQCAHSIDATWALHSRWHGESCKSVTCRAKPYDPIGDKTEWVVMSISYRICSCMILCIFLFQLFLVHVWLISSRFIQLFHILSCSVIYYWKTYIYIYSIYICCGWTDLLCSTRSNLGFVCFPRSPPGMITIDFQNEIC